MIIIIIFFTSMALNPALQQSQIDIAIVGGGPQALTIATHLLQKRKDIGRKFLVFEGTGTWMSQWRERFAALEIPHLRSPAVHHPDPNPHALRGFAESRPDELFAPYDLPSTQLFADFCQDAIRRFGLEDKIVQAKVTRIIPPPQTESPYHKRFRVELQDGQLLSARRVVLATGTSKLQMPSWVGKIQTPYPKDRLCHSRNIDLRCFPAIQNSSERVLIVGGGLTAGHLAIGAMRRGAKVLLMARRQLQEKLFDAEPGWLGPKYLKGFWAETDWERRWELIQLARNGGSMTPAMMLRLRRAHREGQLALYERCQVVKAEWLGNCWRVGCDGGEVYECERIWLSTGTKFEVAAEPLLADVLDAYPTPMVNGLPVLDEHLRWPGCELFVMGGLAALQVGPVARNLYGARMGSERIVPALIKASVGLSRARSA